MEIPCRLRNVEEIISEMDLFYVADDILECDEDYRIVISGWWVHIPELGINLREGVFCNYDETEKSIFLTLQLPSLWKREQRKNRMAYGFIMNRTVLR